MQPDESFSLVAEAQAGDAAALTLLLQRNDDRMRGLAYKLLDDAHATDDVLQDAYIKAYQNIGRFRGDSAFSSWHYQIVYTTCIDSMRRSSRRPTAPLDVSHHPADPERVDVRVAEVDQVRSALNELPVKQRAVVLLVDGEGLSHREAATVIGVRPGTVASRLHRARRALRTYVESIEGDER